MPRSTSFPLPISAANCGADSASNQCHGTESTPRSAFHKARPLGVLDRAANVISCIFQEERERNDQYFMEGDVKEASHFFLRSMQRILSEVAEGSSTVPAQPGPSDTNVKPGWTPGSPNQNETSGIDMRIDMRATGPVASGLQLRSQDVPSDDPESPIKAAVQASVALQGQLYGSSFQEALHVFQQLCVNMSYAEQVVWAQVVCQLFPREVSHRFRYAGGAITCPPPRDAHGCLRV